MRFSAIGFPLILLLLSWDVGAASLAGARHVNRATPSPVPVSDTALEAWGSRLDASFVGCIKGTAEGVRVNGQKSDGVRWQLLDGTALGEVDFLLPPGPNNFILRVGDCVSDTITLILLAFKTRHVTIWMVPVEGHPLENPPSGTETNALVGHLPRSGILAVTLTDPIAGKFFAAQVEDEAYYFDDIAPGRYRLKAWGANWQKDLGEVVIQPHSGPRQRNISEQDLGF